MQPKRIDFICISDTHGRAPPKADDKNVAAWLHAGDFCNCGLKNSPAADIRKLEAWALRRRIPCFTVQGNHDCGDATVFLNRCTRNVTAKVAEVAPHLFVAGVGWSGMQFFDLPSERELSDVCRKVLLRAKTQMPSPQDRCILLTHYPANLPMLFPFEGTKDGFFFDCVNAVIDALKPLAVVQGHAHTLFYSYGVLKKDGREILIVNPGPDGGRLAIDLERNLAIFEPWLKTRSAKRN